MQKNKLLLTHYQDRLFTFLTGDRLLSAKPWETERDSLAGNIYIGKIQNMAKGISAAFVEIAEHTVCFLSMEDAREPVLLNREYDGRLKAGDELLVQVVKDAVKTKQPVVTAQISLSGNYVAVATGNKTLGISAKIDTAKKKEILSYLQQKGLADKNKKCKIGTVIRTNTGALTDYAPIIREWQSLENALSELLQTAPYRSVFSCLRKKSSPYLADLREYYAGEIDEIVTDREEIYKELLEYAAEQEMLCGIKLPPVRFYSDEYSLVKLYRITTYMEEALARRVWLKSGGNLVIEPTEAMTVIDVNTGKCEASGKQSREDTYFAINMEAAEEIALQLRLRNLSGIIIVDFINLEDTEKQKKLLERLKSLVIKDTVRTTVVDMTPLGLVEITRKRVNRPLREMLI